MVVKNSFEFDARVEREATALSDDGHEVHVVALAVPGHVPDHEVRRGVTISRVRKPLSGMAALVAGRTSGAATATPSAFAAGTARTDARATRPWRTPLRLLARTYRALAGAVLDRRLRQRLQTLEPDVVHAHDLNTLAPARRAARAAAATLVYDAHELHRARRGATARERRRDERRERRLLADVDLVLTASPGYATDMRATYDVDATVVLNVPEGSVTSPTDLRATVGAGTDDVLLLYQGTIQPDRGLDEVVRALPGLAHHRLVVAGFGHHRPALERLARQEGVDDRVHLLGPVPHDQLLDVSAGADVGLCTIVGRSLSYALSMPNKLFEYLVAGLPVLVGDTGPMRQFVEQHGVGRVCRADDPAAVRAALAGWGADERRRDAARAADVARAHTWASHRSVLLDAYRGLQPPSAAARRRERSGPPPA